MKFRNTLVLTGLIWGAGAIHSTIAATPQTVAKTTVAVKPKAPAKPTDVAAPIAGPATLSAALEDTPSGIGVRLNWAPVDGAKYYNIYRDGVRCGLLSPLTYLDRTAEPQKIHTYQVSGCVNNKETDLSGAVSANFNPVTEIPANLTAQPLWATCCSTNGKPMPHIVLSWNTVKNALSYGVYRNGVLLNGAITDTSYTDMTTVSGKCYSYTVRTNGHYGQSVDSRAASAVAPSPRKGTILAGNVLLPPTNLTVKNIWVGMPTDQLAWSPAAGALAYNIYEYGDLIASGVSGTHYQVATGDFCANLTYTVTSVDALGMESIPSSLALAFNAQAPGVSLNYTPPAPVVPSSMTGTPEWNNGAPRVHLVWRAKGFDDLYNIYRDGVEIASGLWTLSYFDNNVAAGQTHNYQVSAYNTITNIYPETGLSDPVTVTVAANTLPANPGVVQIASVNANDDSAVVSFSAVPGAADYRVYSTANPGSMKYSGGGLSIEMNGLDPVAGANLVVEAVDKLGPFQTMDGAMGPGAMTMSGAVNIAINGQGDPSDLPRVIARSAVFHVTLKPTVLTGDQVFFDNFRNATPLVQAATIDPAIAAANYNGPADATNPFVQEFSNAKWTIRDYNGDMDYTHMFFMGNHFMDTLFDGGTAHKTVGLHNNNASMVMMPKATADISGGRVLHVTFEVDAHFDIRRWCEVLVGQAGDPMIHPGKLDGGLWPTVSGNRFRWEIGKELTEAKECLGGVETSLDPCVNFSQPNVRVNGYHVAGINGDMTDLDKRHKFDLYLSQNRYRIVENGVVEGDAVMATPLPFSTVQVYFVHQVYHTGNDRPEQVSEQDNPYWYNNRPFSDERHWDNMGFEVLNQFPG